MGVSDALQPNLGSKTSFEKRAMDLWCKLYWAAGFVVFCLAPRTLNLGSISTTSLIHWTYMPYSPTVNTGFRTGWSNLIQTCGHCHGANATSLLT